MNTVTIKSAPYRGHKLDAIVHHAKLGHAYAQWTMPHPFPATVGTLGFARLRTRVDGNIWGLSVSDLPPGE